MAGEKTIAGEKGTSSERSFVMVRDNAFYHLAVLQVESYLMPGMLIPGMDVELTLQIKPDGVSRQLVGKVRA